MDIPSLSLITITKDDPIGLERTMESTVRWRSAPGVEHIVVYAGAEPRNCGQGQAQFLQQTTVGIAAAFNEGFHVARGQWIWFLNGGDAAHESLDPAWLLTLLSLSRADIIVGGIHYDGDDSPRPVPSLHRQWPLLECWLPHPATLIRKETFSRSGGFSSQYMIAMDYDLWLRLLSNEAALDVVSVPFARFDVTGVSQRSAFRQVVRREEASVILRNWWPLLSAALRTVGRVIYRLLWATRHWRLRKQKRPPVYGEQ